MRGEPAVEKKRTESGSQSNNKGDVVPCRKKLFRVGPGLIVAIALSLVVYYTQRNSLAPRQPVIQRTVETEEPSTAILAPTVDSILQENRSLNLSKEQAAKLESLQMEWDHSTASQQQALHLAQAAFQKWMDSKKGRASLQDIQSHAAAVTAVSRELAAKRHAWWQRAKQVLDAKQIQKVEEMMKAQPRKMTTT